MNCTLLYAIQGGDGTSMVTDAKESINLRVQKGESMSDQLDTTERELFRMERKLQQNDVGGAWKCATVVSEDKWK